MHRFQPLLTHFWHNNEPKKHPMLIAANPYQCSIYTLYTIYKLVVSNRDKVYLYQYGMVSDYRGHHTTTKKEMVFLGGMPYFC